MLASGVGSIFEREDKFRSHSPARNIDLTHSRSSAAVAILTHGVRDNVSGRPCLAEGRSTRPKIAPTLASPEPQLNSCATAGHCYNA
jgi:hypothetical protein